MKCLRISTYALPVTLISLPGVALGADVEFKKSIDSSAYAYETTLNEVTQRDQYAAVIEPQITAIVTSRKLTGSLNARRTQVFQREETNALSGLERESGGYTSYSLDSNLSIIDRVLNLSVVGNQTYRAGQQGNVLLSDPVAFSEELSKVQNYAGSLSFVTPNPKWLGFDAQATISETTAEESASLPNNLDSQNRAASATLYSGDRFDSVRFQLGGQIVETQRAIGRDFDSNALNASVEIGLNNQLSWTLNGSLLEYDFGQEPNPNGGINRQLIDTTSYGTGLKWQPKRGRSIEITYNELEEDENVTEFVGANINWAFTPRTSLFIDYGRQFFGDAIQANFNYNLRHFKSSFSYSETVTSFSRANLVLGEPQLFVCDVGSSDLTNCFQPEASGYELEPGEEFRAVSSFDLDLVDEVFVGKSANWNVGYDKGRLRTSLTLGYFETEFLETNRRQENTIADLSFVYRLGKRTNLKLDTNYSKRRQGETEQEITSKSVEIGLDKKVSNKTNVDISFRVVDRASDVVNNDILDKRITLGLNYQFD